jgi:hypothetical protein
MRQFTLKAGSSTVLLAVGLLMTASGVPGIAFSEAEQLHWKNAPKN